MLKSLFLKFHRSQNKLLLSSIIFLFILFAAPFSIIHAATNGFARYPDIYGDKVVFTSSGDLWLVSVEGGTANRITAHEGEERFAHFSPDGEWIAFSGEYYGNEDIFVAPAQGGQPRQLTFHPAQDLVTGWDPNGNIVFRSRRNTPGHAWELYTVNPEDGYLERMPYFRGANISFEPDGKRVALVHTFLGFHPWKRYQGGYAEKIWIGDPSKPEFEMVSHWDGNESFPMWDDNGRLYFTSDSLGRNNIWSMLPDGNDLKRETDFEEFDLRWPNHGGGKIVFQYGMEIGIFDIASGEIKLLDINIPTDFYVGLTKFADPTSYKTWWNISDDGKRLVSTARGELFTLPVKDSGLIRQWTFTSGSREKYGVFLPISEGKLLAVSDGSGEEQIAIFDKPGSTGDIVDKKPDDGWKYTPRPSPDGKQIAYTDYSQQLFIFDIDKGKKKIIDKAEWEYYDYKWSPDSRYLAYTHLGENNKNSIRIFDTESGKNYQVSDPHFNTHSPCWDPDGRYLYCVTTRNFNAYQDYSRGLYFYDNTGTLALYLLSKDTQSPFIAKGDMPGSNEIPGATWIVTEEPGEEEKEEVDEESDEPEPVLIDFNGLADRMVAIPEEAGNYYDLQASGNKLFFRQWISGGIFKGTDLRGVDNTYLRAFDLGERSSSEVASGINGYEISGDGSTIVVESNGNWYYGDAGSASVSMDGDHMVSTSGWTLEVDPKEEWKQILHEAWRHQRDFFYDPNLHGVDWEEVYEKYAPFIERIVTRDDLRDLIREIQSELHAGHAYIGPGDEPHTDNAPVGFLGVDLVRDKSSGYFKITNILAPEPGTKNGVSPLYLSDPKTQPGTYIIAVNGKPTNTHGNFLKLLQNQAGIEVSLTLNEKPDFEDSREVIIKTLRSEGRMRYYDWVKKNREYVDKKSGGKIGYIHLPDMGGNGLSQFGRDYYPQQRKDALIIDDRYNGGGNVAEYMLKELTTEVWALQAGPRGMIEYKPHGGYLGHMAVLCNGETMSDGESFAEATKRLGLGPLIGERTWGGWVWIRSDKPLVDRAYITEPEFGGWGLDGEWMIEGRGVDPDIEVWNNPAQEMKGIDQQLDKAIEVLLQKLKDEPVDIPGRPDGLIKK